MGNELEAVETVISKDGSTAKRCGGVKGTKGCGQWLPLDDFGGSVRNKDGKNPYCLRCCRSIDKARDTVHPLRRAWSEMKRRCYNPTSPKYRLYGKRGVTVCRRWQTFRYFEQDILALIGPKPSPDHSLDRYPLEDGNYEPGNVRWATRSQQGTNKRAYGAVPFRGVTAHGKRYQASICVDRRSICLGTYPTPEQAAMARDSYVVAHNLDRKLNFPEDHLEQFTDTQVDSALITLLSAISSDPLEDPSTRTRAFELGAILVTEHHALKAELPQAA